MIRPARENDGAAIASLTRELGYAADAEEVTGRLRAMADEGGHAVLVAEVEGAVVGWLHVHGALSLVSGPLAELGAMVVSAGARRRGVGSALLEEAARWARVRGHTRLRVRSQPHRSDAHRFYRLAGFREVKEQTVFDLAL